MKRFALLTTILTAALALVLPFIGGGGPALSGSSMQASASGSTGPVFASSLARVSTASAPAMTVHDALSVRTPIAAARAAARSAVNLTVDTEHLAQKPVPIPVVVQPAPTVVSAAVVRRSGGRAGSAVRTVSSGGRTVAAATPRAAAAAAGVACPAGAGGGGSAPSRGESGIGGTTTGDIQSFSATFNAIRVANCLQPIASGNFRYDSCMEQRLFWMAEDPSTNPGNTWGHAGVKSLAPDASGVYYSNAVPAKGCDGNLAGGSGNSGATVAQKWWDSLAHRASLYRPTVTGSTAGVCIYFAMTHGGVPSESPGYTRAAARWGGC